MENSKSAITRADKLRSMLAEEIGYDESQIRENTTLNEMGFDSFDRIEIALWIAEEFDIDEVLEEEIERATTFRDLVKLVELKLGTEELRGS